MTQIRSITDGCHSLHSNRYQKVPSLRRPRLNCRELILMHENTLQIANVISFSGLLQLLKQHLESACCQRIETELISLSPQDARVDEDGWLSLKGVLYFPQFSDTFKFYILPFCLYLCSEYLFLLLFTTFIMKTSNQYLQCRIPSPTTLSTGQFVQEMYSGYI